MNIDILVAEIGSTTTILNAFNGIHTQEPNFVGQGQAPTTVLEGDVNIGILNALENLKRNLNCEQLEYQEMFATSSAAGGLKMTVHGLVYDMTVKAAREAALGAGANLSFMTGGKLLPNDLKRIVKLNPNIILLAGGVDFGDRETACYNAEMIAQLDIHAPVIYAGNISCQEEIKDIFEEAGKKDLLSIVPNVYPKVDELNIEPVRKIIHDIFEKHIIYAPGMQEVKSLVTGAILPTPGSVMEASKLLKEEIGDLVTIDVGGATTDIHSVTEGTEDLNKIVLSSEPTAKRTVEGDLGVYINKNNIISLIGMERLIKVTGFDKDHLQTLIDTYPPIPQTDEQKLLVEVLTSEAVTIAMHRHAGVLNNTFTGDKNKVAVGKDLTAVRWLIATGGALTRLKGGPAILASVCNDSGLRMVPTTSAKILQDHDYIMASVGILSKKYRDAALRLMKKSLKFGE